MREILSSLASSFAEDTNYQAIHCDGWSSNYENALSDEDDDDDNEDDSEDDKDDVWQLDYSDQRVY